MKISTSDSKNWLKAERGEMGHGTGQFQTCFFINYFDDVSTWITHCATTQEPV